MTLPQHSTAQQPLGYLGSSQNLGHLSTKQENIILQMKRNVSETVVTKSTHLW